jgi:hypothetical protein
LDKQLARLPVNQFARFAVYRMMARLVMILRLVAMKVKITVYEQRES